MFGEEPNLQLVRTNDIRDDNVIGPQIAIGRRDAGHCSGFEKDDFVGTVGCKMTSIELIVAT